MTQAELASRTGLAQGTISKLESGMLVADVGQASAIADALDYPIDFFQAPGSLAGPGLPELYHERRRKSVRAMLLQRAYATASVRTLHIERLLRSCPEVDVNFPPFPAGEFEDPAKTARTLRAHWEMAPGPVFNVTETLERAGAFVMECDFDTRHIDGFSKWRRPSYPPMFFINRALPPDRWRWTLAHELGHLIMHSGEMPRPDMEREADAFAEEFLMPSAAIKGQLLTPSLAKLASLKVHWKVSIQSLIERSYHLDVIGARQRTTLWQAVSRAGYRLREPEDLDPPREPPRRVPEVISFHLKDLGYSVSELAAALLLLEPEFRATYLPEYRGLTRVK